MLLLLSDRRQTAEKLTACLFSRGVYLFCGALEAGRFLCDRKDTGGVILDGGANPAHAEKLCRELRKTYPDLPIAYLAAGAAIPDVPADRILRDGGDTETGAYAFCTEFCGWREELSTFYLTVGKDRGDVWYMGERMPLSAREHAILRCLLYRAPRPTSTDDLMELCYPLGREKIANLSVQISNINRKARLIDARRLIVNEYGIGYRLRDGIVGP